MQKNISKKCRNATLQSKGGFTHTPIKKIGVTLQGKGGFTFIEMIIVVSIFAVMAGIGMFNYKDFEENVEFNNLAYDIALTLKQAQTYGISSSGASSISDALDETSRAVGVYFDVWGAPGIGTTFLIYRSGSITNDYYNSTSSFLIDSATIGGNVFISQLCYEWNFSSGLQCTEEADSPVSLSFRRPNPEPTLVLHDGSYTQPPSQKLLIEIEKVSNGDTAYIIVEPTGQIRVQE